MCGIAGIFSPDGEPIDIASGDEMAAVLSHRGPDGWGRVTDGPGGARVVCGTTGEPPPAHPAEQASLGLWHRRLAIIDLSEAGAQPMADPSGRFWISYNGEIYNYQELRATLGGLWSSKSDTEVLLRALLEWGMEAHERLNGIWAFALWDRERRRLWLSRDRFGVKPLYYAHLGRQIVFASEPKAILAYRRNRGGVAPKANQAVLGTYFLTGCSDYGEETFFEGIRQVPAGCVVEVEPESIATYRHYALPIVGPGPRPIGRADELLDLFSDAVRLQLRSDVTVGHCVSGGLDSSSIAAVTRRHLAKKGGGGRQLTFSACFPDWPQIDERRHIEVLVDSIEADAHFTEPSQADLFGGDLERLIYQQDEPLLSLSMYAQYRVFELVSRAGIKVVLDGQGADELLAGYLLFEPSLLADLARGRQFARMVREAMVFSSRHRYPFLRLGARSLLDLIMARAGSARQGFLVGRLAAIRARRSGTPFFTLGAPSLGEDESLVGLDDATSLGSALRQTLLRTTLPQLLRYEDRNSMAFGVEARVPFLDQRLVEWALRQDPTSLIIDGATKAPLRQAMKGIVPQGLLDRRDKLGYVTPDGAWLSGTRRDTVLDLFSDGRFASRGWYRPDALRSAAAALKPDSPPSIVSAVWRALNVELWARTFLDGRAG